MPLNRAALVAGTKQTLTIYFSTDINDCDTKTKYDNIFFRSTSVSMFPRKFVSLKKSIQDGSLVRSSKSGAGKATTTTKIRICNFKTQQVLS
jgi:hypothetical protein